jgi:hypothetical protein
MVGLFMTVCVIVREENFLVDAVASKKDSRSSKTGEQSLEAIPAREGTCVSPCLTVHELDTKESIPLVLR